MSQIVKVTVRTERSGTRKRDDEKLSKLKPKQNCEENSRREGGGDNRFLSFALTSTSKAHFRISPHSNRVIYFKNNKSANNPMELSAIGEQVFAVESIIKKRVRKVGEPQWELQCDSVGCVVFAEVSGFIFCDLKDFKQLSVYIINMTPCLRRAGSAAIALPT